MKKPMPFMGKESKMEEKMEKKKSGGKAAYAKGEVKEYKGKAKEMAGKMKMLMKAKKK
jgi:hypothetical protein